MPDPLSTYIANAVAADRDDCCRFARRDGVLSCDFHEGYEAALREHLQPYADEALMIHRTQGDTASGAPRSRGAG